MAFALRFDASYLELAGVGRGAKGATVTGDQPSTLTELPADTAVAVSVANAGDAVGTAWDQIMQGADGMGPQVKEQIDGVEQQLGLNLPQDLHTLLWQAAAAGAAGAGPRRLHAAQGRPEGHDRRGQGAGDRWQAREARGATRGPRCPWCTRPTAD